MKLENGVASSYLVMTNIKPEEWCAVITEQRQTIGRAPESEVRVAQRFRHVSRRHAEIWQERQFIKIRDLGSQAGTNVNGVWVKDSREATVACGDRIWMGGLELELVQEVTTLAKLLAETKISMVEDAKVEDPEETMITAPLPTRFTLAALSQGVAAGFDALAEAKHGRDTLC